MQLIPENEAVKPVPTYGILIPVYERTFGFAESLASALEVRECTEILVVDDQSSHDAFKEICAQHVDPRIRYVRNEKNRGLFGNWNHAVSLSRSDFVSILCSDDLVASDIFTCFLQYYRQDSGIDVFFGSFATFSATIGDARILKAFPPGKIDHKSFLENAVDKGPGFPVLTVAKRSTLLSLPFVAAPHSGNDWLWIWSNAHKLNLYATGRAVNYWRRHQNQDAVLSQSVTMDCWPIMYLAIASQLKSLGSHKSNKAKRQAIGIVLTFLLNDKKARGHWAARLIKLESRTNNFLVIMNLLVSENRILKNLLRGGRFWFVYYHLGRILRRLSIYPSPK